MTVCMGYPAMTPKWESRITPLEWGRNTMQRERRMNNDILFHFRKDGLPMTKLSQLKIDPEFQNQINPPSFEETHQLEMNILKEERVLNPIITWNGYIVDGHLQHRRLSIPQPEAADRHHQPDAGRDTTPTGYRSCPHL